MLDSLLPDRARHSLTFSSEDIGPFTPASTPGLTPPAAEKGRQRPSTTAQASIVLAKLGRERVGQTLAPISQGLELAGEEPQHGRLVVEFQAAHQVGIPCAAVTWGFADGNALAGYQPNFLVTEVNQILDLIS